jgi:hypothetical protein
VGYLSSSTFSSLLETVQEIAVQVQSLESRKRDFGENLRASPSGLLQEIPERLKKQTPDDKIAIPVSRASITAMTVGAVDGGLIVRRFAGADMLLSRAVGVIVSYNHGGIYRTDYFPSKKGRQELLLENSILGDIEFDAYTSLLRETLELETASSLLKTAKKRIDILLMDGPVIFPRRSFPHPRLNILHERHIQAFKQLSGAALEHGTLVGWVVKDSRSRRFVQFLGEIIPVVASWIPGIFGPEIDYRSLIRDCRDIDLLDYMLLAGDRSFALQTSHDLTPSFSINVVATYLKAALFDSPLRLEFIASDPRDIPRTIERLVGVVLPLSEFHPAYALPAPLVEADARSRIRQGEFQAVMALINSQCHLRQLKRERSPFVF